MSDNEERLAGHSPAMMVGGMRVSKPKVQHEKEEVPEVKKEEEKTTENKR